MIRVEVQDYCQSCLEFEPDVENPTLLYAAFEVIEQTDTVIRCKHRTRCENIKRHIDKEKEKGGNKTVERNNN
jgi:hypothetical protein